MLMLQRVGQRFGPYVNIGCSVESHGSTVRLCTLALVEGQRGISYRLGVDNNPVLFNRYAHTFRALKHVLCKAFCLRVT